MPKKPIQAGAKASAEEPEIRIDEGSEEEGLFSGNSNEEETEDEYLEDLEI